MFRNLIWAANFLNLQKLPDCLSSYKWPGSEVGGRPTSKICIYTCTCSYMHLIYDLTECIWPLTIHNPRGKLYRFGVANSLVILATDIIGMPSLVLRLAVRGTTTLQSTHWPHPSSTTANHLVNQHVHCPSDVLTRCGRVASSRETNTSTLHSLCFWLPAPLTDAPSNQLQKIRWVVITKSVSCVNPYHYLAFC